MAKLRVTLVLVMNMVVVGTASASILHLSNPDPTSPVTLKDCVDPSVVQAISKTGSGTDIVPISLTNTGHTAIDAGVLQFSGRIVNLQHVDGCGNMEVGDGIQSSDLTATSICVDTLTLSAGSTLTIQALDGGPQPIDNVSTPEPVSWVIWLLIGLITVLVCRHRS
jgi:hypothetical protein